MSDDFFIMDIVIIDEEKLHQNLSPEITQRHTFFLNKNNMRDLIKNAVNNSGLIKDFELFILDLLKDEEFAKQLKDGN